MLTGLTTIAFAQKAPNLVTVDMQKALAGYERLQEATVKFEASVATAREELEVEGQKLQTAAEGINELQQQGQNPALTEEKLEEIRGQLQEKVDEYRQLEADFNQMRQRVERTLAERRNNIMKLHLEEIKDAVKQVCKERGADLAINNEGNLILFADAAFDITNDVLQSLNASVPTEE